nr:FctA domain-containing protein [uncultured Blautia sp.]
MLKKVRKGISGLFLAGVLFLNAGTTALAADITPTPVPTITSNLKVMKYFEMAEGLETPAETFTFEIESNSNNPKNTPLPAVDDAVYTKDDSADVVNGKRTIKKEATITLPKVTQFPHAGEYLYTLTEVTPVQKNENITYSNESYTLRVRVKNAATGNGLDIASVTANKNPDGDTANNQNKVGEISFTNTYAKNAGLTIEKKTTGDYADRTKKFKFTITFTKKSETDATKYTGKIGNTEVQCTAGEKAEFYLGNGDKLIFNAVPVGTRYVVEETAEPGDGYTPVSVTVTENGTETKKTNNNEKSGISSEPQNGTDSLVGEKTNKVVFENHYDDIPITGIIMNNLPFILLIGVAVLAFGALVILKKRSASKR